MKNQYRSGRLSKKGGLEKKRGVVFLKGVETAMHTMCLEFREDNVRGFLSSK